MRGSEAVVEDEVRGSEAVPEDEVEISTSGWLRQGALVNLDLAIGSVGLGVTTNLSGDVVGLRATFLSLALSSPCW